MFALAVAYALTAAGGKMKNDGTSGEGQFASFGSKIIVDRLGKKQVVGGSYEPCQHCIFCCHSSRYFLIFRHFPLFRILVNLEVNTIYNCSTAHQNDGQGTSQNWFAKVTLQKFAPTNDGYFNIAILSVYDKRGLLDLAKGLSNNGIGMLASGGTAKLIREAGFQVE